MVKLRRVTGDDLFPGAKFFNDRADAIEAMGKLGVAGALRLTNASGNLLNVPHGVKLVMFELVEDMQMPDPSGISVGDSSVPWTDNAKAIWYTDYASTQDYTDDTTYSFTLYFPNGIFRNPSGITVGPPTFSIGSRVWATFVNGRWDVIAPVEHIWRFELKTALAIGGSARAYLLSWTGAAYVPNTDIEFTVYDSRGLYRGWTREAAPARSGSWGLAIYSHDRGVFEIIDMQHIARSITFTTTEDMVTSTSPSDAVTATVNDYYRGTNPAIIYPSGIKVHDPQGIHLYMTSGSKGKATFDDRSDEYHITEVGPEIHWFKAQSKWESNSGDNRVSVKQCDRDGTNVRTMTAVWVYLPRIADCDPTVFTDDVIGARVSDSGVLTCVTMYGDGSKIGDIRLTSLAANIRPGWREADGASSAWDCKDRFIVGRGDDNAVGDEGGYDDHGDTPSNVNDHETVEDVMVDAVGGAFAGTLEGNTGTTSGHTHTIAVGYGTLMNDTATDNRPAYKTHIIIERFE